MTALAAAALLVLTACSDAGTDDGSATPAQGGTLRVAAAVAVDTLDPVMTTLGNTVTALYPVFDRLVELDETMNPVPGLAESWEFAEDGLALTLHLREGIEFQDGTPFDAEAVKENLDRAITAEGSAVAQYLDAIDEITVDDERTVTLHLLTPNSALPAVLADAAGMMMSPAAADKEGVEQAVGTGPYVISEYVPNESITYTANPDYWGDTPKLDGIVLSFIADSQTAANALIAGEQDVLMPVTPAAIDRIEKAGDITVDITTGVQLSNCYLRLTDGRTLSDPLIRQALQYAVDRDAMNEVVYLGTGAPTVLPVSDDSFAASDVEIPAYDPDHAAELLAEAGYPDGIDLDVVGINSDAIQRYVTVMQEQMAQAGIRLNVDLTPGGESSSQYNVQGLGDMRCANWSGRPDPYLTYAALYGNGTSVNPEWSQPAELAELLDATVVETDPAARSEAFAALNDFVVEGAYSLPMLIQPSINAYRSNVLGYEPNIYKPDFSRLSLSE